MSVSLEALARYTDELLACPIGDYCPNGLQVEGRAVVNRIVSGVTASQALIDRAIELDADLLLVHHGFFWKGENACITGMKKRRLSSLLQHDVSLLAYHLPLDVHEIYGNNVQLALQLGIDVTGKLDPENRYSIGLTGQLPQSMSVSDFKADMTDRLQRSPLHIPGKSAEIRTVAWCTGGAQGYFDKAVSLGVDAYISGEISEPTVHIARETGVHYFAAGHHATERYGVQALGQHLAEHFSIEHVFVDIDNPV